MEKRKNSVTLVGSKTEIVNYSTSIFDIFSALRTKIYEALGLPSTSFLDEGKIYKTESRSNAVRYWDNKTLIKDTPTEEELEAVQALDIIEKVLKKHFEKGT